MGQVRYAPTQVLPCIEVEVGSGPGTNYPFGKFDLNTPAGCRHFDLFAALSARVKEWTVAMTADYHSRRDTDVPAGDPPVFTDIVAHVEGGGPLPTAPLALGPADVVLGDVSYNGMGLGTPGSIWNNPHVGFREFEALNNPYIITTPDYVEENFILPDVRLVNVGGYQSGPLDSVTLSNQDGPASTILKASIYGDMTYNKTVPYGDDPPHGPLYYHSYRNRYFGYVALSFKGGLIILDEHGGTLPGGWEFACNTHLGELRAFSGQPFRGPIGTFTIQWPNPLTNELLSVSCPIFGIPISGAGETLEYSFSAVATPSKCYRYDDIFADDGTSNRDPTQ